MADLCDFCGRHDAHWSYPSRDFVHDRQLLVGGLAPSGAPIVAEIDLRRGMAGAWLACEGCHALIGRGDRDRLCRRSAKHIQRSPAGMDMSLSALLALLRPLQDQFWSNREGLPSRL